MNSENDEKQRALRLPSGPLCIICVSDDHGYVPFVFESRLFLIQYMSADFNMSNMAGATSNAGTAYTFGVLHVTSMFLDWVHVV